jgi:hypothetical protein
MCDFNEVIDLYHKILNEKHKKLEVIYSELKNDIKYLTDEFRVKYYKYSESRSDDVVLIPEKIDYEKDINYKKLYNKSIGISEEAFYYVEFLFKEVNNNYYHYSSENYYEVSDLKILIKKLNYLKTDLYDFKNFDKQKYINKIFIIDDKRILKKYCKELDCKRMLIINMISHITDFIAYCIKNNKVLTVSGP